MKAHIQLGTAYHWVDLDRPVSLAAEVVFTSAGLRHFGAPVASSRPLVMPGFCGSVAEGASCNCSTISLTPHCNGTHTECAGHLTAPPMDAFRIVPLGLLPTVLVTVAPEPASAVSESDTRPPRSGKHDRLITQGVLAAAWPSHSRSASAARALVIRTLPNSKDKLERTEPMPPYLSPQAALWIVGRGIEHLVVDLPSVDRVDDGGDLAAHRVFFGLAAGARELGQGRRAHCTITELAYVPDDVVDGEYLLELQVPAICGDAVPSRPLLYALEAGPS